METKRLYVVKTWRMKEFIEGFGIKMLRAVPDNNNPKYNIFLFEDTLELRHILDKKKKFNKQV